MLDSCIEQDYMTQDQYNRELLIKEYTWSAVEKIRQFLGLYPTERFMGKLSEGLAKNKDWACEFCDQADLTSCEVAGLKNDGFLIEDILIQENYDLY